MNYLGSESSLLGSGEIAPPCGSSNWGRSSNISCTRLWWSPYNRQEELRKKWDNQRKQLTNGLLMEIMVTMIKLPLFQAYPCEAYQIIMINRTNLSFLSFQNLAQEANKILWCCCSPLRTPWSSYSMCLSSNGLHNSPWASYTCLTNSWPCHGSCL